MKPTHRQTHSKKEVAHNSRLLYLVSLCGVKVSQALLYPQDREPCLALVHPTLLDEPRQTVKCLQGVGGQTADPT